MFSKSEEEKQLKRYEDPTGQFSNQQLKLADWYVKHKILLKKIGLGIIAGWCVISVGYSLIYFAYYLVFGYNQDQKMYARQTVEFENYEALQPLYKPQELEIKDVRIFKSAEKKYDFVAQVFNPNERWVGELSYYFFYKGGQTETMTTVLLPGEQRPVIYFGEELEYNPGETEMVLENLSWHHISPHAIVNVEDFVTARKKFNISDFKFTKANKVDGALSNIIEFDLYNESAYSFWQPEFYIELYDGRAVGYLYVVEQKFKNGEKRHMELRFLPDNIDVKDIKVYPVIDVFNYALFMKPGEE
ncbi:MAG TPA: hypothetical protein DEB09_02940 [Candidatus Magasanikbacteria bacterium]|nr:hypothetical protein [Candidatus Magasanikbacteria bacterium]